MKKIAFIVMMLLALPAVLKADFQSNEDFFSFVFNYYKNPQPEQLTLSFAYYVNSPYRTSSPAMISQFYSTLLKGDRSLLKDLFEAQAASRSVAAKNFMLKVLFMLNTAESTKYLARAEKEWRQYSVQSALILINSSDPPIDVLKQSPQNPEDISRLWGIFWATGNEQALSRIISVLHLWADGRGAQAVIGSAARWSLPRSAPEHPKIIALLKQEQMNASGTQKRVLTDVIAEVETRMAEAESN